MFPIQKLTTLVLTSLLAVSLSIPANAQQVNPGEPVPVDSGATVTDSALVMSLERGRALLKNLDSLSALSDSLESQVAKRDTLINQKQEKFERCTTRLAEQDSLIQTERAIQEAQDRHIKALQKQGDGFFEDVEKFIWGGAAGSLLVEILESQ